jgi:hypothetical protein
MSLVRLIRNHEKGPRAVEGALGPFPSKSEGIMEYTLTRFKPNGKWYDDIPITFPEDIKPYANREDVLKAYFKKFSTQSVGYWHFVMMETPWGYPMMIPSAKPYSG